MRDSTDLEFHLPNSSFIGPGTNLKDRLNPDNTPKPHSLPKDRIDALALEHDLFYNTHTAWRDRMESDIRLINGIRNFKNLFCRELLKKYIVIFLIGIKIIFTRFVLMIFNVK